MDWNDVQENADVYIPVSWRNAGIRDPTNIPLHLLPALYVKLFEAQHTTDAFNWQRRIRETAAATQGSSITPATPRRTTRTVYSTPSKRTPSTQRLSVQPSPAQGSSLQWPSTPPAPEPRASSVPRPASVNPSNETVVPPTATEPRPYPRPRPVRRPTTAAVPAAQPLETIEEAGYPADEEIPEWVPLRNSAEREASGASETEAGEQVDELEADAEQEGAVVGPNADNDAQDPTATKTTPPPPPSPRKRASMAQRNVAPEEHQAATQPAADHYAETASKTPPPPPGSSRKRSSKSRLGIASKPEEAASDDDEAATDEAATEPPAPVSSRARASRRQPAVATETTAPRALSRKRPSRKPPAVASENVSSSDEDEEAATEPPAPASLCTRASRKQPAISSEDDEATGEDTEDEGETPPPTSSRKRQQARPKRQREGEMEAGSANKR